MKPALTTSDSNATANTISEQINFVLWVASSLVIPAALIYYVYVLPTLQRINPTSGSLTMHIVRTSLQPVPGVQGTFEFDINDNSGFGIIHGSLPFTADANGIARIAVADDLNWCQKSFNYRIVIPSGNYSVDFPYRVCGSDLDVTIVLT